VYYIKKIVLTEYQTAYNKDKPESRRNDLTGKFYFFVFEADLSFASSRLRFVFPSFKVWASEVGFLKVSPVCCLTSSLYGNNGWYSWKYALPITPEKRSSFGFLLPPSNTFFLAIPG